MKKNKQNIFPIPKKMGRRDWGSETLLVLISKKISLKILKIKKGKKGGLQYHRKKNECGYVLSGKLLVRYENEKGKLINKICKAGDSFHFAPGLIHQEEALTNCSIIEASTPHFNDRVRVESKYGLRFSGGLKSTKLKDIKLK
tara:strand:+ start:486 stop:914 length:429 start_codon:yes stop_codon:yes gene_type:complete